MSFTAEQVELAWAAGLYDGEGCTFLNRHRVKHYGRPGQPTYVVSTPTITICQVDRSVLDRFCRAVGHGRVRGPYKPKTKASRPYHRVNIEGRERVAEVLTALWPFLDIVKREQAREVWRQEAQHRGKKSPPMPPLPEVP